MILYKHEANINSLFGVIKFQYCLSPIFSSNGDSRGEALMLSYKGKKMVGVALSKYQNITRSHYFYPDFYFCFPKIYDYMATWIYDA